MKVTVTEYAIEKKPVSQKEVTLPDKPVYFKMASPYDGLTAVAIVPKADKYAYLHSTRTIEHRGWLTIEDIEKDRKVNKIEEVVMDLLFNYEDHLCLCDKSEFYAILSYHRDVI